MAKGMNIQKNRGKIMNMWSFREMIVSAHFSSNSL